MTRLTSLFPVLALLAAIVGYAAPFLLTPLSGAIVYLLALIMFSMGLSLSLADFKKVINAPMKILLGTVLQFLLMPLAAFLIAHAFALDRELLTGLVLVGCCPGGTASNVICFLSRGDLALSIALTMVSTLLSVVATPLLTLAYLGQAIDVPVQDMMASILQIVIVPVVAGLLINTYQGHRLARMAAYLPAVSVVAIVLIIGIVVALNSGNIAVMGAAVLAVVVLHNLSGVGSAYGLCRLLRYDEATCRTIAIEVGMQNSGLGVALATQFYSASAALPGALFSLWHNLSGACLAGVWGREKSDV